MTPFTHLWRPRFTHSLPYNQHRHRHRLIFGDKHRLSNIGSLGPIGRSLLPSSYVGGRARGMSWCRQLTGWLSTSGLPVIISLSVSHPQSHQRNAIYINGVDGPPMESLEWRPPNALNQRPDCRNSH